MCRAQSVLALVTLCVGLAHSWDIAVSAGDLLEFYTNGTKTNIVHFNSGNLAALAYDEVHNMMLYVDKQSDNDAICGYNLYSKDIRCFIKRYGGNIHSIAFDPVTEFVFFSDTNERSINWISLKPGLKNNLNGNVLIKMDDRTPSTIAVDSCRGYIYWSNINKGKEHMERARFDGSEREVLRFRNFNIYSLGIDPETQIIYYMHGFKSVTNKHFGYLTRADFDGRRSKQIFSYRKHLSASEVFTVSKDSVYWMNSSESFKTVWQLPKSARGVEPKEICKIYNKGPFGIAANYKIKEQTQGTLKCEALSNLKPTITVNNHSLKTTEQTTDTDEPTETEETTITEQTPEIEQITEIESTLETEQIGSGSTEDTTDVTQTIEMEQTIAAEGSGSTEHTTDVTPTTETEMLTETEQTIAEEGSESTEDTTDVTQTIEMEQTIAEEGSGSTEHTTDVTQTTETELIRETEQTTAEQWSGYTKQTSDVVQTTETEQTTKHTTDVELFCVHGIKVTSNETSVCKCTPGYIGERCDVSVCVNYCLQGNCSFNDEGRPKCRCNNGYSGQKCEVNVCYNYCLNNGDCSLNKDNEPVCQCVGSYEGSRCEAVKNDNLHFITNSTYVSAEKNLTLADLLSSWRARNSKVFVTVHNNYY